MMWLAILQWEVKSLKTFFERTESFLSSTNDVDENKVVVELSNILDENANGTENQRHHGNKRRHGNPLEWLQEVQCGSENRVGEAASSKFLTKGVNNPAPMMLSARSEHGGRRAAVPQSADRGAMRPTVDTSSKFVNNNFNPASPMLGSRSEHGGIGTIMPQSANRGAMRRELVYEP